MRRMRLSELFLRAGLVCPPECKDVEITGIVTDSRKIISGCLFICIKGLHTDSHLFMEEAARQGASVIVAEHMRDVCVGGAAIVTVDNTRKVSALLYSAWFGNPGDGLKLIGVTETNGKTSVTYLLRRLFEEAGYPVGVIGTVACTSVGGKILPYHSGGELANMTTPDPDILYEMLAKMAEDGAQYVFMEVTSHALALGKCDALHFDAAVFTNLTQDHLDFHTDMEHYYQAKAKLFTMCRKAVINTDDIAGQRLYASLSCVRLGCSLTGNADYRICDLCVKGAAGSEFLVRHGEKNIAISLPLPGEFMVSNALLSIAVACEYGISPDTVCKALASVEGVPGRMETVLPPEEERKNIPFSVLIDYAHTPDALENLLRSARQFHTEGRLVLLFGCGGERDRTKRAKMAKIASEYADFTVITGDNSRGEPPERIFSDILSGMDPEKPYTVIPDRKQAIEFAVGNAKAGDCILLAGKGHEQYEISAGKRLPFCERQIVLDAMKKYEKKNKSDI